jgi:hypothetical protein
MAAAMAAWRAEEVSGLKRRGSAFFEVPCLAVDDRVLAKDDDLARGRHHEGGSHGARLLAVHLLAMREVSVQVAVAVDVGASPGAVHAVHRVPHIRSPHSHETTAGGRRRRAQKAMGVVAWMAVTRGVWFKSSRGESEETLEGPTVASSARGVSGSADKGGACKGEVSSWLLQ